MFKPTLGTATQNGVTCTNNGDGTYTLNGTATAQTLFSCFTKYPSVSEKIKLVCCPSGGSLSTYFCTIIRSSDWLLNCSDIGNGVILSDDYEQGDKIRFSIIVESGAVCDNLVFKPMLTTNLNATYDDFVPYTGSTGQINSDVAEVRKDFDEHTHEIADVTGLQSALDGKADSNHTHSQYLTSQDISQVMKNRGFIGNTTDFNTLVDSGCYKIQVFSWGDVNTYHGPNEFNQNIYPFGLMLVIRADTTDDEKRITQIYFPHNTGDKNHPVVMRTHNGSDIESGWQPWHRFSNYVDSAAKATQDESGNNIKASYAATMDISGTNLTLKNKNGEALKSVTLSGGSYVGSSAPSDTNILWIDTGNGGVMKYYNGSSWTPIASTWG